MISPQFNKPVPRGKAWSHVNDVVIMAVGLALFSCVVIIARRWFSPVTYSVQISLRPSALPAYAAYSLLRIAVAYFFSLVFAVAYGYMAAYNTTAERIMLPILDILQSIPVLSFLPGVMLAMAALFPHTQLGLELGSVLLIFTGQVWNIAFSFYSSLKGIPRELIEAARINRFSKWQRLTQLELPFSAIGLVWNSMMSVAGGWFFLMVCEMFTVGSHQVMLPGLGSYLQSAASANNTSAIVWGLAAMIGVIVLLDQLVWRPVIAWANKFKFEEVESASAPDSAVLNLIRRSAVVEFIGQRAIAPLSERLTLLFAERPKPELQEAAPPSRAVKWIGPAISAVVLAGAAYALFEGIRLLTTLQSSDLAMIRGGAIATFLRVAASLIIGAAWTIPVGVAIGFNPKLARIAQPIVQIAASIPATGYYPVLIRML
ncbi:MAG: ABC transporter permease subunit, partial [Blastocatellia bacterium]